MTGNRTDDLVRTVEDLGLAAYLKMKGFKVSEAGEKGFQFICEYEQDWSRIRNLEIEYFNGEFSSFDGMVMEMKRMPGVSQFMDQSVQIVRSVAQAAYLQIKRNKIMLNKEEGSLAPWSVLARQIRGRHEESSWAFEVGPSDIDLYTETLSSWPNSPLREFNQQIMNLKLLKRNIRGVHHGR